MRLRRKPKEIEVDEKVHPQDMRDLLKKYATQGVASWTTPPGTTLTTTGGTMASMPTITQQTINALNGSTGLNGLNIPYTNAVPTPTVDPNREMPWTSRQKSVIDEAIQMIHGGLGHDSVKAIALMLQADAATKQASAMVQIGTSLAEIAESLQAIAEKK